MTADHYSSGGDQVVIFRHQMFRLSEPFIAAQAEQLRRFRPLYVGRTVDGKAPDGARVRALEQLSSEQRLYQRLWQAATRDPRPYLRLLSADHPALIHAQFGVEGVYALPLAAKLNVPLVTTFYGFDATLTRKALLRSRTPAWANYVVFRHRLATRGDLFICVSKYLQERVLSLGFPPDRTHVNYIGVDTAKLERRDPSLETPTIVHVGRLVEKKGTKFLILAFVELSWKWPDVRLAIIGDGPLRPALEALASEKGVAGSVLFLGSLRHEEVMAWVKEAAILAVPSVTASSGDMEGLPMILVEGAALGLPVVASRHSGIPEVVIDGDTGYLVEERDVGALAERMGALLTDDELRLRMGRRARSVIEDRFALETQTAKLEALYEAVLR